MYSYVQIYKIKYKFFTNEIMMSISISSLQVFIFVLVQFRFLFYHVLLIFYWRVLITSKSAMEWWCFISKTLLFPEMSLPLHAYSLRTEVQYFSNMAAVHLFSAMAEAIYSLWQEKLFMIDIQTKSNYNRQKHGHCSAF